jgi:hypothetical protein
MTIELSDDEALVLFELLVEYGSKDDGRELKVSHAAERNALWALSAQLEKQLVAPFKSDYAALLSAARERVEHQGGTW